MTNIKTKTSPMELNDITPTTLDYYNFNKNTNMSFIARNTFNNKAFEDEVCLEPFQAYHHEFLQKKPYFCLYNYIFITSNLKEFFLK